MDFIEYSNAWAKIEVLQGKIMVAFGILTLVSLVAIFRSENELLRGAMLSLALLLLILIGYGSYILYSPPVHSIESISLYKKSKDIGITKEMAKHVSDNKASKTLLRIYPILMLVSIIALFFISRAYYKGMALGFAILFTSLFIIDNGFVSRSNSFISFLEKKAN